MTRDIPLVILCSMTPFFSNSTCDVKTLEVKARSTEEKHMICYLFISRCHGGKGPLVQPLCASWFHYHCHSNIQMCMLCARNSGKRHWQLKYKKKNRFQNSIHKREKRLFLQCLRYLMCIVSIPICQVEHKRALVMH